MSTIDLNRRIEGHHLDLKITPTETSKEEESRLRREEAQSAHDRWRSTIAFAALVLAAFGIAGIAAYMLLGQASSADDKKWGASILTALFTGAVGYMTGQKAGQAAK